MPKELLKLDDAVEATHVGNRKYKQYATEGAQMLSFLIQ